jgi:hypothetical protein
MTREAGYTKVEKAVLDILITSPKRLAWKDLEMATGYGNRVLRAAKESLIEKGVPLGSTSGTQKSPSGYSSEGGVFLIRTAEELQLSKDKYHKAAITSLGHEAQLDANYYKYYNTDLFGCVEAREEKK